MRYYRNLLNKLPELSWSALEKGLAIVGAIVFIVLCFNKPLGKKMLDWDGISPFWAFVPIGLAFFYYLAKATIREFSKLDKANAELAAQMHELQERVGQKIAYLDQAEIQPRDVDGEPHYGITIKNVSVTASIERCGVEIIASEPELRPSAGKPIPLHCSGKERRNGESGETNISAGGKAYFDLVRIKGHRWEITGAHTRDEFPIDRKRYVLTLRAHAKDVRHETRIFILESEGNSLSLYPRQSTT